MGRDNGRDADCINTPTTNCPTTAVNVETPMGPATGVDSEEELHLTCATCCEHFPTRNDPHRRFIVEKHQLIDDHDNLLLLEEPSDDGHDDPYEGNRRLQVQR